MTRIEWDKIGERRYETGVDHGVLYLANNGVYDEGYGWNGLTTVTEAPSGAEATAQYADNLKYLNLISIEEFGGTIEAFTYPDEWGQCDGTAEPQPGVRVAQQNRRSFGLSFRTRIGNDVDADLGYKIHLVYGATASPAEKAYATINDSPEALAFSWDFTTIPVPITGLKTSALLVVDSTVISPENMMALENALYGTAGSEPRLPLPDEIIAMLTGSLLATVPTQPTFASVTGTISIPSVAGTVYKRADTNATVTGDVVIAGASGSSLIIYAVPASGYYIADNIDTDWQFTKD
jgi:hypothetical protein